MSNREFVLEGDCTFTLRHGAGNKSYTYKIEQSRVDPNLHFVYFVERDSYEYLGMWCKDTDAFIPAHKYAGPADFAKPSKYRALEYFIRNPSVRKVSMIC